MGFGVIHTHRLREGGTCALGLGELLCQLRHALLSVRTRPLRRLHRLHPRLCATTL